MIRAHKFMNPLAGMAAVLVLPALTGASQRAFAQAFTPPPVVRSSGPILAAGGETLLVCVANNQAVPTSTAPATAAMTSAAVTIPLSVTLQILNGVTGAVLAQAQISPPPLGSTFTPPDPCVNYVVPAATFAPSTNLFLVRIALNPQPLPPGLCALHSVSASVQVFTAGPTGNPTNIRAISFEPPDPCLL